MAELPDDVLEKARKVHIAILGLGSVQSVEIIAAAIMAERQRVIDLLKDPAAVRVGFYRGDIACQKIIAEERAKARNEALCAMQEALDTLSNMEEHQWLT